MMTNDEGKQLEIEADHHLVKVIGLLSKAIESNCFVYGKLRYVDTKLLKKSIQLVMTYKSIDTLKDFANEIKVSTGTLNKMIQKSENTSMNRLSIDKLIDYMTEIAKDTQT